MVQKEAFIGFLEKKHNYNVHCTLNSIRFS